MPTHDHFEIDSDVDLRVPSERDELRRAALLLGTIAIGGVLGAVSRFAVTAAWAAPTGAFPWPMLTINTTGCFALGTLMAYVSGRAGRNNPVARPLLGTGLLGGYTSFSTYAVDVHHLLITHRPALALIYLAASVIAGVAAVVLGRATATRAGRAITGSIGRRA